jgi:hypothetical protein
LLTHLFPAGSLSAEFDGERRGLARGWLSASSRAGERRGLELRLRSGDHRSLSAVVEGRTKHELAVEPFLASLVRVSHFWMEGSRAPRRGHPLPSLTARVWLVCDSLRAEPVAERASKPAEG